MKRITVGLILLFCFPTIAFAGNCTPEVKNKRVLVELVNEQGKTIYSETLKVRKKKKYAGLIVSEQALNTLTKNGSGNIKIGKPKFKLSLGGNVTKISKKGDTTLAIIGGCPISKLKFYSKMGSKKKPFVHLDVVSLAAKSQIVVEQNNNDSAAQVLQKESEKTTEQAKQTTSNKGKKQKLEGFIYTAQLQGAYGIFSHDVASTKEHVVTVMLTDVAGRPINNCRMYIYDKAYKENDISLGRTKAAKLKRLSDEYKYVQVNASRPAKKGGISKCFFNKLKVIDYPEYDNSIKYVKKPSIDVIGLKLGMTLEQIKSGLSKRKNKYEVQKVNMSSQSAYTQGPLKGHEFVIDMNAGFNNISEDYSKGVNESVRVEFSIPPSKNLAVGVSRQIAYSGTDSRPPVDQVKNSLFKKYGKPFQSQEGHASAHYTWIFNGNNALSVESLKAHESQACLSHRPDINHEKIYKACRLVLDVIISGQTEGGVPVVHNIHTRLSDNALRLQNEQNTRLYEKILKGKEASKKSTEVEGRSLETEF